MKKRIVWILLAVVLLAAVGARIYFVNTEPYLKYLPKRTVYPAGEEVPLPSGQYYFLSHNWEGYTVEVTGSRIERTEDFLAAHNAPEDFLKQVGLPQGVGLPHEYLCIVTAVFRFNGDIEATDPILLSEFHLIGPDYHMNFLEEFASLEGFNPKLQGNIQFRITSSEPITVELPFFIETSFDSGMTLDYFQRSDPQLVVAYLPEERCIAIN